MTPVAREHLLVKFNGNPPADPLAIRRCETDSGLKLPEDYVHFLAQTNGGEGFVGNAYVILWRVEELFELNKAYQVPEYAPGLFLFGSDGGGEAFAFDTRSKAKPIVSVPFVGMDLSLVRTLAENLNEFLEKLFKS